MVGEVETILLGFIIGEEIAGGGGGLGMVAPTVGIGVV